ncbi:Uncharacterised protein [Mycobacteroides abscessus subsp. massiliense]|nr:Uncharacterised protein [Mycobacteroides abscessus subsp. massiliense]
MLCAVELRRDPLRTPAHIEADRPSLRTEQLDLGLGFGQSALHQAQPQASLLNRFSARICQCQHAFQLPEAPRTTMLLSNTHHRIRGAQPEQDVCQFDCPVQPDTSADIEYRTCRRRHRDSSHRHLFARQQPVVMADDSRR